MPAGPGKETVAAACSGCHEVNRIRAGYTPAGWRSVIQMMKNVDAPVPQAHLDLLQRPAFPAGVEQQRHRGAGAERAEEQLVGRRAGVLAARVPRLVGGQRVPTRPDLLTQISEG